MKPIVKGRQSVGSCLYAGGQSGRLASRQDAVEPKRRLPLGMGLRRPVALGRGGALSRRGPESQQ